MPATVWALGVVLYEMVPGFPPLQRLGVVRITGRNLTLNARDPIRRCLYINPDQRLRIDQILAHDWFKCIITHVPATPTVANYQKVLNLLMLNTSIKRVKIIFLGKVPMAGEPVKLMANWLPSSV
nr:serine/threonine-protein kinase pim-3-like [Misgurnus anguillicaudatus]